MSTETSPTYSVFPTAAEVATRLGLPVGDVLDAYLAEATDQTRRCRFPDGISPPGLQEALHRRVARAMAMRNLPLGVLMDETGGTRVGGTDPEVRRLEAPYRKVVVG